SPALRRTANRWAGLRAQRGARDLGKKSHSGSSNEASTPRALIWTPSSEMRTRLRRLQFTSRWFRFHLSEAARSTKIAHLFHPLQRRDIRGVCNFFCFRQLRKF